MVNGSQRRRRQRREVREQEVQQGTRTIQNELSDEANRVLMENWPLSVKLDNIGFRYLDDAYIRRKVCRIHPDARNFSEEVMSRIVAAVQRSRVCYVISDISELRFNGETITEENLLEYVTRINPQWAQIGMELYQEEFRKLLIIDPVGTKRVCLGYESWNLNL